MGGSNAIPAFSSSGTLHLGYRGLFYSECCTLLSVVTLDYCIKQHHLNKPREKLFHDLPWMRGSRSLTSALNSSALAGQGGGVCCCPNGTPAPSSGIQHGPNKCLLKPPRCFSQSLVPQAELLNVLPARLIHSHAEPELGRWEIRAGSSFLLCSDKRNNVL